MLQVDVAFCGLVAVPEALAGVGSVTSLMLDGNHIKRGWEQLRTLRTRAAGAGPQALWSHRAA